MRDSGQGSGDSGDGRGMAVDRSLLISGGTVVTLGEENRVLPGHDVLCEGGSIARIEPHGEIAAADRVIDAAGKLVMPGFINAHTHFYSTFARGLGKAAPARDFNGVLRNLWWRLDRALDLEDCRYSALVVLIDAVRHGTTTLIDHHASPGAVSGSLAVLAEAVREVGVRACLCYEVSDRDGEAVAREGIAENERFIARCRSEKDGLLRGLFGLHASFTVGDATLARAVEAGQELGAGFHVHVAEAASDQEHCLREHGVRVVERLHSSGVLGADSIAAHCVHVDDHEVALLADSGTAVAHNAQSNMNNAVGVADLVGMQARGVRVGLGTDAMTVDMREEARVALWAQRLARKDPATGFAEVASALLRNNPAIASRLWGRRLGEIGVGVAADMVVLDYHSPTPLEAANFAGHLLFGLAGAAVDATVVAGRVLLENGRLALDLDENEVAARARERARALWSRF
jgi:putative selenium metabolism protein SsnA